MKKKNMKQYTTDYPIDIAHEMDGIGITENIVETFKTEKPYLRKCLIMAARNNMRLNVGDTLYGYDELYYVKRICFYPTHVTYWVNENPKKIKN